MASYQPNRILPSSLTALLSGHIRSFTDGQLEWIAPGATSKGEISAVIAVQGCRNGRLIMSVNERVPFRPTFAFVVNDVPAYRVCVHDDTTGIRGTHGHRYEPGSGRETGHSLANHFAMIKNRAEPSLTDLRNSFEEFAALVNVDLNDGYWVDPWEEAP